MWQLCTLPDPVLGQNNFSHSVCVCFTAVGVPAHQNVARGITTGAMTEAMIVVMIDMTTENITDHTSEYLLLPVCL